MFCTSIIPTVCRDTLRRAVQSVLDQNFSKDSYEVIVVNDSGAPLPTADWRQDPLVRVVDTNHRERCVARNVGAALARGKYLHFLDDDDWLLPGALERFWNLSRQYSDGAWLYGGTVIFDREDKPVINLVHHLEPNCFVKVMSGEWIPLQASFINQTYFHRIGGFNPLIPGIEDVDLARRMALHFDFHGTGDLVAGVGLGVERSTTNQAKARLDGRQARELILNESGVYQRLWQSADKAYWHGRIVRLYLTSATWNLSHGRFLTALSRIHYGIVAMLKARFGSLITKDFWKAILGPYESEAFALGQAERQKSVVGVSE